MVKGVNKTVIEVNDTGSKIFEKIVFYVSPQHGNDDISHLQRAAGEYSQRFNDSGSYSPLREIHRKRQIKKFFLGLISVIAAAGIAAGICFL